MEERRACAGDGLAEAETYLGTDLGLPHPHTIISLSRAPSGGLDFLALLPDRHHRVAQDFSFGGHNCLRPIVLPAPVTLDRTAGPHDGERFPSRI
jgi:hypothetical protein